VPTARGYHQLVAAGDAGLVLISGLSLNGITAAQADREYPGRPSDPLWHFSSASGWEYAGAADPAIGLNIVNEAEFHPGSNLIVMYLSPHPEPAGRMLDPLTGAVTSAAIGAAGAVGPMMAYDAESDRMILFGGDRRDTTWAYDPVADEWTRMEPDTYPSARNYGAMAYDPISDRVVLFGGHMEAETWAYDYNSDSWTELTPAASPPGRDYTSLVYDPVGRQMVMFGGLDGVSYREQQGQGWTYDGALHEWDHTIGDTWSYDPAANTWTNLEPLTAPPARGWHAMAYEESTGLIVLFGGGPSRWGFTNETWLYDPSTNTWSEWSP
jgi:hypothetical protein